MSGFKCEKRKREIWSCVPGSLRATPTPKSILYDFLEGELNFGNALCLTFNN